MPLTALKTKIFRPSVSNFYQAMLDAAGQDTTTTLASMRSALQEGGEDFDKEDFFGPAAHDEFPMLICGSSPHHTITLIKEVLDILAERGQSISIEEFTKKYGSSEPSVIGKAASLKVLGDLFSSNYWANRTDEMDALWAQVPERDRARIDYSSLRAKAEALSGPEFEITPALTKAKLFKKNSEKRTPLDDGRTWKKIDQLVEALEANGEQLTKADLLRKNTRGATYLEVAIRAGQQEKILALLERQNDKLTKEDVEKHALGNLFGTNNEDFHRASASGDIAKVKAALALGLIDIEYKPTTGGSTPLWVAAKNGRTEVVEALIEAGANLTYVGPKDETVLNTATLWADALTVGKIVAGLEKQFADDPEELIEALTRPDRDGDSPARNASRNGSSMARIINDAVGRTKRKSLEALKERPHKRIAIVGAGFSGTVTAIHLLNNAREPLEIMLIEKSAARRSGGIAYSAETASEEFLTNLPIARMSAFENSPRDLEEWLNTADRADWPERYRNTRFASNQSVPRVLYQKYLEARLQQAISRNENCVVTKKDGEVVDVIDTPEKATILFKDGTACDTNQTILATGYTTAKEARFAEPIKDNPHYIREQYTPEGQARRKAINKDDTVLIIGTGLSAYDAVISLKEQGHEGKIILMSRGGHTHPAYSNRGVGNELRIEQRPAFMNASTVLELINGLRKDFWERTVVEGHSAERVVEAYQRLIPELIQQFDGPTIKQLLRDHSSLIATLRIGVSSHIARIVEDAKISGQLQIIPANIHEMTAEGDGINVRYTPSGSSHDETIEVGHVMSCLGRDNIKDELWQNIAARGQMQPHFTGHGIQVGTDGQVIDALNAQSQTLIAVGPMRGGDSTARIGWIGPPTFAVPGTRQQMEDAALLALQRVRRQSEVTHTPVEPKVDAVTDAIVVRDNGGRRRCEVEMDAQGNPRQMNVFIGGQQGTLTEVHTPGDTEDAFVVTRYQEGEAQPPVTKRTGDPGFTSWHDVLASRQVLEPVLAATR
ncbi:MAG: FAD/NAD(P)-binding protein [Rickettsiales bacterium]